jgi:hypothetical protein
MERSRSRSRARNRTRTRTRNRPRLDTALRLFAPLVLVGCLAATASANAGAATTTTHAGTTQSASAGCTTTAIATRLQALGLSSTQHTASNNGFTYTLWSGHVASWDGVPLEVYLTLPSSAPCALPLVSYNNGFGDDASTSLGSTDAGHWNNLWFAEQGDAALNFTQRGFGLSCGPADSSNGKVTGLPKACTQSGRHYWMTMDDMRYNTRDLQWLIGDLVDASVVNPNAIAVTGESMGGELSWEMALLNNRTICGGYDGQTQCGSATSGYVPWKSPAGVALHIAASVPAYGWYSEGGVLMPNGTASDGLNGGPAASTSPYDQETTPVGIPNLSWVSALDAAGLSDAFFAAPGSDTTADWANWFADLQSQVNTSTAAPGTSLNTALANMVYQFDVGKSAGSSAVNFDADVPILALQGLDDSLMTPVQAQLLYTKAKTYDPNYPISVVWGDVGHQPATNPADLLADFATRANAFLSSEFGQSTSTPTSDESAYFVRCGANTNPYGQLEEVTAKTLGGTETGSVSFNSATTETTTNTAAGAEATAVNPQNWNTCPTTPVEQDSGVASWTWTVGSAPIPVLGAPVVTVAARSTASDAQLDARLWLEAGGNQTLISSTAYRFVSTANLPLDSTVSFEIPMTAWLLQPGQTIKLEITGDDAPTYQADSIPSTTTIDNVTLKLPTTDYTAYGTAYALTATHGVPDSGWLGAFVGVGANLAGNFQATLNWGDGTTSTGTVSYYGSAWYVVSASHTWTNPGTYPTTITLVNTDGVTVKYYGSASVT